MKRFLLHLLFWAVYLLQDSIMQFTWTMSALPGMPDGERIRLAIIATVIIAIPKAIFTYFVVYFVFPRALKYPALRWWLCGETLLVLTALILAHRCLNFYIVGPIIYHNIIRPTSILNLPYLLLTIMDLGFVSGYAFTFKLLRMQLSGKEREKNLLQEKLQTELKFLRNQTHPHFLFNTLNNIYALARKRSDKTAAMILKLSKLLRFMLYESGKGFICISEEIRIIDDYLELQKLRFNERLSIQFHRNIDQEGSLLAPLLLLPFVENAFKHGVSETRFNSFVHIDLQLQNEILQFIIANTTNEDRIQPEQIGLGNVRRQLELMYHDHSLKVTNAAQVFTVQLTLNLQSHAKI
ncbi:Histidine kinase [Chitinophaga costaii]|uniref:Histidine kinase n=1 Tax=Chitinophaga costaii TaxID=1335309 RepID=A0A1C4BIX1_9BACT|nr:sensor histidine kinase [Chitinophaga costaii]PUZ27584.1 histidine kinase [Chitinophaga costaii]SCC06901.1 Histidine kinase [Chitinophaga costaii]